MDAACKLVAVDNGVLGCIQKDQSRGIIRVLQKVVELLEIAQTDRQSDLFVTDGIRCLDQFDEVRKQFHRILVDTGKTHVLKDIRGSRLSRSGDTAYQYKFSHTFII